MEGRRTTFDDCEAGNSLDHRSTRRHRSVCVSFGSSPWASASVVTVVLGDETVVVLDVDIQPLLDD
jgi:hypothetical protein